MRLLKFYPYFLGLVLITVTFGCQKDDAGTDNATDDGNPITETELIEVNSFTTRVWTMFLAEAKYLSANGSVDSTYTEVPIRQEIRFNKGGTNNPNLRVYSIYDHSGVIERFWPGVGDWTLSPDGRTLTISQNSVFPEPGKPGGAFAISYNPAAPSPFPYAKALGLKQTTNLSGGRKIELRFILGSN
jgi:hypothetical protein